MQYCRPKKNNAELIETMRRFDQLANVEWPLVHFRTAARYLDRKPEQIAATGGTNWKDYMPPKNQLIMFFLNYGARMKKITGEKCK